MTRTASLRTWLLRARWPALAFALAVAAISIADPGDEDGDGVNDGEESNWDQPMEGGDGNPCALTPDCDGDGILDGDEGGFDGGDDPGCRNLQPGAIVDTIGTIGGNAIYFGWVASFGTLGIGGGVALATYVTPKGCSAGSPWARRSTCRPTGPGTATPCSPAC